MAAFDDEFMPDDLDGFPMSQPQDNDQETDDESDIGGQETSSALLKQLAEDDLGQGQEGQQQGEGQIEGTKSEEGEPDYTSVLQAIAAKAKFNHGQLKLESIDDAIPLIQKGANYDKIQERYNEAQARLQEVEKDPSRSFLQKRAQNAGLSVDDYIKEIEAVDEQRRLDELMAKNIPEDYAREMLDNKKFRETYQSEQEQARAAAAANAKQEADTKDFLEYFAQENGRPFNPQADQVPQEVWEMNSGGVPLKLAFMEHQAQLQKTELARLRAEVEQTKARQTQNQQNQQRAAVGSVSAHGGSNPAPEDPFLKGFEGY